MLSFFSWTERPFDSELVGIIGAFCKSRIGKSVLIGNPRWPQHLLSWKSILKYFSWTERQDVSCVPQGPVLGAVLFLIFINDYPEDLNSRTRFFVDNCTLCWKMPPDFDQQLLQQDLDKLASWEKKSGMKLYLQKCSLLRMSRARSPRTFHYHLKCVTLVEEQWSKYLAVDRQ